MKLARYLITFSILLTPYSLFADNSCATNDNFPATLEKVETIKAYYECSQLSDSDCRNYLGLGTSLAGAGAAGVIANRSPLGPVIKSRMQRALAASIKGKLTSVCGVKGASTNFFKLLPEANASEVKACAVMVERLRDLMDEQIKDLARFTEQGLDEAYNRSLKGFHFGPQGIGLAQNIDVARIQATNPSIAKQVKQLEDLLDFQVEKQLTMSFAKLDQLDANLQRLGASVAGELRSAGMFAEASTIEGILEYKKKDSQGIRHARYFRNHVVPDVTKALSLDNLKQLRENPQALYELADEVERANIDNFFDFEQNNQLNERAQRIRFLKGALQEDHNLHAPRKSIEVAQSYEKGVSALRKSAPVPVTWNSGKAILSLRAGRAIGAGLLSFLGSTSLMAAESTVGSSFGSGMDQIHATTKSIEGPMLDWEDGNPIYDITGGGLRMIYQDALELQDSARRFPMYCDYIDRVYNKLVVEKAYEVECRAGRISLRNKNDSRRMEICLGENGEITRYRIGNEYTQGSRTGQRKYIQDMVFVSDSPLVYHSRTRTTNRGRKQSTSWSSSEPCETIEGYSRNLKTDSKGLITSPLNQQLLSFGQTSALTRFAAQMHCAGRQRDQKDSEASGLKTVN